VTVRETDLPGVLLLEPDRHRDDRGFFSATWNEAWLASLPADGFVQDNHSFNRAAGTVRGLHYQEAPHAQAKLLRVVAGSILDVAVDLRPDSDTFARWTAVELSAENWRQLFVPAGFAHGFCTLEPDTHVLYKISSAWTPEAERGIAWNDPDLGIEWPEFDRYVTSERDGTWPSLASLSTGGSWPSGGGA
jgi:dTDP-4-dehydrorhamnose 3,5-epimerase